MNKERRKQLEALKKRLEAISLSDIVIELTSIREDLAVIESEEQEYYDNMAESFQNGEKGQNAQAAIDAMESADSDLGDKIDELDSFEFEDICGSIDEAIGV